MLTHKLLCRDNNNTSEIFDPTVEIYKFLWFIVIMNLWQDKIMRRLWYQNVLKVSIR